MELTICQCWGLCWRLVLMTIHDVMKLDILRPTVGCGECTAQRVGRGIWTTALPNLIEILCKIFSLFTISSSGSWSCLVRWMSSAFTLSCKMSPPCSGFSKCWPSNPFYTCTTNTDEFRNAIMQSLANIYVLLLLLLLVSSIYFLDCKRIFLDHPWRGHFSHAGLVATEMGSPLVIMILHWAMCLWWNGWGEVQWCKRS